jgi:hypothetical protein
MKGGDVSKYLRTFWKEAETSIKDFVDPVVGPWVNH